MANYRKEKFAPGLTMKQNVEKLLDMLAPYKQPAYRRIAAGDEAFASAYKAADKDLPICAECGHNCRSIAANLDFGPQFWSHCCHANIEQDAGA